MQVPDVYPELQSRLELQERSSVMSLYADSERNHTHEKRFSRLIQVVFILKKLLPE